MPKRNKKITILDLVNKVLESDLPTSTRNSVVRHYLLPGVGQVQAPVELKNIGTGVGAVERPNAEEIAIEGNPILKAGYEATEKLMGAKADDDE